MRGTSSAHTFFTLKERAKNVTAIKICRVIGKIIGTNAAKLA